MAIEVRAETLVARPVGEVFEEAAGRVESLAKYFTGYAPLIPGIREASFDHGAKPAPGALRTVKLTDGTTIKERVLEFEAPRVHGYDMAEMNALQRLICTNMVSRWTFAPEGEGTRVVWSYAIHPKGALMGPVAWLVSRFFEKAMQRCLDNVRAAMPAKA